MLPSGEIVAAPWRGAFTGNRGCLHDDEGRLGRARWKTWSWVTCLTAFRGRKRPIMPPGRWTALFFWDEAAAFAAGHRPCGECRNADYKRFRQAWEAAGLPAGGAKPIDRAMQAARVGRDRCQRCHNAPADDLPDGVFLRVEGRVGVLSGDAWHPWLETGGYGPAEARPSGPVTVLTPAPTVAVFRQGYRPSIRLDG
ncbi:MAG: hypothetical protein AAF074_16485 [Pseudomonadota bacterium]